MSENEQVGPDGTFIHGSPLNPDDRGSLNAGIRVLKDSRQLAMNFGTSLNWLTLPPQTAHLHAILFRLLVEEDFGILPYDASTLPLKVVANKENKMVEIFMPVAMEILVANPEVFLAWADRLDEEADILDKL